MNRNLLRVFSVACFLQACLLMEAKVIPLHDGWVLQGKYKATVPSTVMGVLTDNGEYPGLLEGTAYKNIDRTRFDVPWTYTRTFRLSPAELAGHVILQLDGISYRANVRLNGQLIADSTEICGTYTRHTLDITEKVKNVNLLEIEVSRARAGEPNAGYVDWNPRPADESLGIIRPVSIITCGDVMLKDPSVMSEVNATTLQEAWLQLSVGVRNFSQCEISGFLRGSFDGRSFQVPVTLKGGEEKLLNLTSDAVPQLYVMNPKLWWCHNMGTPTLYRMKLEFVSRERIEDSFTFRFGIREIGDFFTEEGNRGFTLNGRRVLVRGAGWTDDIFMRDTPKTYRLQLGYVSDMNLNAIRMENIWGNSQDVFELCDSLGIMVLPGWTCHWEWEEYLGKPCDELYGGMTSDKDIRLMVRYLHDQVLWLRRHPSIICWFVGSDKIPCMPLEEKYRRLLRRIDPSRPYITSAKKLETQLSGTAGMKMAGPYDYVGPSYWYSCKAPGGAIGFNTETGIGAQLPQRESLERMLGKNPWPISSVWGYHCTASASSMGKLDKLQEVVEARYGTPQNLYDFLHKADLANYESTRAMFEAFRVNIPKTTGIIQWMLNAARPGLYWQLYDHYLVPNASYYSVRKGNAPLQLIYDYGRKRIVAVNETFQSETLTAEAKLYSLGGDCIGSEQKTFNAESFAVEDVFPLPEFSGNAFLFLYLKDRQGHVIACNDYALTADMDVYDWDASDWVSTPISHYADYRSLSEMPTATVAMEVDRQTTGGKTVLTIRLTNQSGIVAFFLRMALTDKQGCLVVPAHYTDNYVSLEPHTERKITCTIEGGRQEKYNLLLDGWNVKKYILKVK